jgi:hypothetical protein
VTPPVAVATLAVAALQLFAGAVIHPAIQPVWAATPPMAAPATASQSGAAEAAVVEIAVVGSAVDLTRMRALLGPRPARGATIHWRRLDSFSPFEILRAPPEPAGARALATRCWIDLTDRGHGRGHGRRHAHLYFSGRSGARFLIRDVDVSDKFDELDLTSLAEVIDSSLTAVVEDDLVGITRAEAERLLAQQTPAPQPRARDSATESAVLAPAVPSPAIPHGAWSGGVAAGVFYAAQGFATELPVVSGPGVIASVPVLSAGGDSGWQLGVWISGQYQIPASANADLASVRLAAIATRAGLLARWPLGRRRPVRIGIEARLGAGADTIHLTPRPGTQDGSAALTGARWSTSTAITGAAGVVARLGDADRVRLGVRAFADLLPVATHYDVAVAGQPITVVAPDRVRPGLVAELTVVVGR